MGEPMLEDLRQAGPSVERVAAIRADVTASLQPVRPLAADGVLMLRGLAVFLALALLCAVPVGFAGFRALGEMQRVVVYAAVLLSAALLSAAVVEQMIPGSRRRIPIYAAVSFPIAAIGLAVPVLFPEIANADFVRRGYPCLVLGLTCAVPAAAAAALLMRRGWVTDPLRAMLTAGALSGLVGVGTLELHCPIFNAPHILVWHLGLIPLCAAAGAGAGLAATSKRARI